MVSNMTKGATFGMTKGKKKKPVVKKAVVDPLAAPDSPGTFQHWVVKNPSGNQYVLKALEPVLAAHGKSQRELENLGWSFAPVYVK